MSEKARLLDRIRAELAGRLQRLEQAARDAHAAATDPGSKAESKYDTRSLEASYLAAGQARQVGETAAALRLFENLTLPDFDPDDSVGPGALVELDLDGETQHFLLVPAAGGLGLVDQGREITLLSADSPLYGALLGRSVGDALRHPRAIITEIA